MTHFDLVAASLNTRPFGRIYAQVGKRVLDVILTAALMPVAGLLIAVLWLATRATGIPGFYGHDRVGQHGAMFRCWKIRTMHPNAAAMLADHLAPNPRAAREWAATYKLQDDPRVTRFGLFLRKTSLDELPQLWNVLRGEMSLVGPRPITVEELPFYGPHRQSYLEQRPGLTGLWQVRGRGNGCYVERVQLDRHYASAQSLPLDLRLLFDTVLCVLRSTGK